MRYNCCVKISSKIRIVYQQTDWIRIFSCSSSTKQVQVIFNNKNIFLFFYCLMSDVAQKHEDSKSCLHLQSLQYLCLLSNDVSRIPDSGLPGSQNSEQQENNIRMSGIFLLKHNINKQTNYFLLFHIKISLQSTLTIKNW